MGTRWRIVVAVDSDEETALEGAIRRAFDRVATLDLVLSDYVNSSELSRLSAIPIGQPQSISTDLLANLSAAREMAEISEGAFDPTIGPLVRLWRRARRTGLMPLPERLEAARAASGWRHFTIDSNAGTVTLLVPGMHFDLGGIAKGRAADEALAILRNEGFPSALVDGGGDIAIGEAPPGESGWRVVLEPLPRDHPEADAALELHDCGLATSGDAFRFVEIEGRRFSHIVDPRSGLGLEESRGVTVVARDAGRADALATALSVLDLEAGFDCLRRFEGAEARIVRLQDGSLRVDRSPGFPAILKTSEGAQVP